MTKPCPTDDSHFGLMDGRCVYFSKYRLTYDQAIENCKEKMKDYGKGILYQPKSISEQKRIVDMAYEQLDPRYWHWIGVNDIVTEGHYVYNSNNQTINFNPDWYNVYGSQGQSNNCIMIYVNAPDHVNYAKWADMPCTDTWYSICMSIN